MAMKFSIITALLNEADRLPLTLSSVKTQQGVEIEHIIVDGGSTDGSYELAGDYAESAPYAVRLLQREPKGIYNAINEGLPEVSGDVVAVLHANDSYTSPDVLRRVAEHFLLTGADAVHTDAHFYNPDSPPDSSCRRFSSRLFQPQKLRYGFAPPHCGVFVGIEAMRDAGSYCEDMRVAADFEMMVRLFLNLRKRVSYLPLDAVAMSTGGLSTSPLSRLYWGNKEKLKSLRRNGIDTSPLRLLGRYFHLFD